MKINRRTMLTGSAALAGLAAAPTLWAQTTASLGSMQVDTLSDGTLTLPFDFMFGGMPQDELGPIIERYDVNRDAYTPDCNVTLVRDGENVILFDVGAGAEFQASAGQLWQALDVAGVDPADVTHVVFTHAHPDHLWGVIDDFGDPMFYNATHLIGRKERDYWLNPETVDEIGVDRAAFAVGAKRRIEMIDDMLESFDEGDEILPGILAHASFGHTPGHMSFELRNGSDSLMIVGDAIGNYHVAFERPDWASGSDQDPDAAVQARTALLDKITTDQMALIGYHLPYPGIGRAERRDGGYVFVPA